MERNTGFFWGALVGGTVAALTTLLFTTKKGKQLQHKISDVYDEIEGNVTDTLGEAKEKVEGTADHLSKKVAPKHKHEDQQHK